MTEPTVNTCQFQTAHVSGQHHCPGSKGISVSSFSSSISSPTLETLKSPVSMLWKQELKLPSEGIEEKTSKCLLTNYGPNRGRRGAFTLKQDLSFNFQVQLYVVDKNSVTPKVFTFLSLYFLERYNMLQRGTKLIDGMKLANHLT